MSDAPAVPAAPLTIAMAAGEASGDLLGAELIEALRAQHPALSFAGIAGPRMRAAGCECLLPAERLSVMGFVEVAGRYVGLMRERARLVRRWRAAPPEVFVGIDAPDFNLGLARRLRAAGIPTVHYVSPSVWAWRRYRLRGIRAAVDRMLTLFPFEAECYRDYGVDVRHVGHPLADAIERDVDRSAARQALDLDPQGTLVALLPGSRMAEVEALAETLFDTAHWLGERRPGIGFVVPAATPAIETRLRSSLAGRGDAVRIVAGQAQTAMAAADVVVLASGTATLEALLLKRPMVVTYRVHPLTYRIMKALIHVPHVSLPNLLAGRELVPEYLQDEARPELLGQAVLDWLDAPARTAAALEAFDAIHASLALGASARAAQAVLELVRR